MANPIQRIVRLVLDRAAAKRTEEGAKKSLSSVEKGMNRLKKAAASVGGVLAAAFGVRAIINFGKASVKTASEATAIWGRLEQAVNNTGVSFANVRAEIDAQARAMQDATIVGDEDFAAVLAELITTSQDYEASLRNVSVVADLAAAKNMDLRSAAQLVGRAMVGQTSTLTRYGIVIKEGEDAMEVLRKQFAGFAEAEGASFEGRLKRINNEWGDFKQAVGDAMIEAGGGTDAMTTLAGTIQGATAWLNRNRMEVVGWAQAFGMAVKAAAQTFVFLGRVGKNSFEALGTSLAMLANDLWHTWSRTINAILGALDKIPGVNIEFRMNEMTPEQFAMHQAQLADEIAANSGNMKDALVDLAESYRDVGRAAIEAANAQGTAVTAPRSDAGGVSIPDIPVRIIANTSGLEATVDRVIKIFEDLSLSIPNQIMADMTRQMKLSKDMASLAGEEFFTLQTEMNFLAGTMRELLENGMAPTDSRLQALAGRLRDVQHEQDMVTRQHEIMAGVAESTGDILNAAFGAGIGELAAGKAKQNAIMSAEQLAMGLVSSLNPFTAPKAAGHYAAAGQFAGIAAAWGGLAGATGGFSGGGGSVGGFRSGRGEASERSGSVAQPAPELNIYLTGEGFDAVNPRVQRVVQGALREAQAATGPNARVRIYRQNQVIQESS